MPSIPWLDDPEEHDYAAALSYLSLVLGAEAASASVASLRAAPPVLHPAKDVLRAAGLGLLPADDRAVARDLKRIRKGRPLSPVLLVRGRVESGIPLTVADGYHRVCAAYRVDEDVVVRARLADLG